jgi:iron complex outermembrane receptor protein
MKSTFKYIYLLVIFLVNPVSAEQSATIELDTIVVTNTALSKKASTILKPSISLSGDALRQKAGANIGDALKNEPGMSNQSFGAGVGRPVIRGQSGTRAKVLQNNLGSNDVSSLSPDHANSVEPILAEKIEVFRGPSTLLFGSGAIGGIVNVTDNRIPETKADKIIGGAAEQRYNSVSNQTASVLKLEGGKQGFAYHLDGFYSEQGNTHVGGYPIDEAAAVVTDPNLEGVSLDNPKGVIQNSQMRSKGGSVGVSYIGDFGLAGASANTLGKNYGIPSDGTDSPPVNIKLDQNLYNFKTQLNKPFALAENLKFKFGYTDYKHVEYSGSEPQTTFLNKTYESRLELEHKAIGIVNGNVGFQSVNTQFSAIGNETVIPKTELQAYSVFAVEKFKIGRLSNNLGVRVEWTALDPKNANRVTFLPVSGSGSISFDITDNHQLDLAFMHTQRAPQIQELFSNGIHDATYSYELGNPFLKEETSNNLEMAYHFKSSWFKADVTAFGSWISNYIYQQLTGNVFNADVSEFESVCSNPGSCFPVLASSQAAAIFRGFEAQTVFTLLDNKLGTLDLSLFADYTRGTFDAGGNVPRMPPLRYGFGLNYEKNNWSANLRFTRGEAQNNVGVNDTTTGGYLLLNLGSQYHIASYKDSEISLFANANNLLNQNIRNSTSYLRSFAPEPGRGAEIGIRLSY